MRLGLPRKRINAATPPIVKMIATITPPIAAIIGILVDGLEEAAAFSATTITERDGLTVIVPVVVAVGVAVIV